MDKTCTGQYLGEARCPLGQLVSVTRIYTGLSTNPSEKDLCPINSTDCRQYIDVDNDRYQYIRSQCDGRITCDNVVIGPSIIRCDNKTYISSYLVVEFSCRQSYQRKDGRTDGRTNERTDGRIDACMRAWMHTWMHGWMTH